MNYYHEKKLAHAYLISTNNINKCLQVLLNVIKNIFCVDTFSDNCNKCSLCHLIDINNLPSLKIIAPDGEFIKKSQILELKNFFAKNSIYTNESIYIILNAEKMNKESANTMLKFLEEPDSDVIGFFLTNEKDNILPTILSRCQELTAHFPNAYYEELNIAEDKYQELNNILKEYLMKIEIEKRKQILYNREYLSNLNLDRSDIKVFLQMMLFTYKSVLNNELEENSPYSFLNKYSFNNIEKKTNLLIELLKEISYNVNVELLLDRLVIEFEVINNETL